MQTLLKGWPRYGGPMPQYQAQHQTEAEGDCQTLAFVTRRSGKSPALSLNQTKPNRLNPTRGVTALFMA